MEGYPECNKDIVIADGGVCGLATALAFHRKGISSTVLERSDALRATGAAIRIQTNGWRALDHLGVGSKLRQTSVPLLGFREVSPTDMSSKFIPIGSVSKTKFSVGNPANELPAETIKFGCRIVAVVIDANTKYPTLYLHDRRVISAKVVVGCDGVNSETAKFLEMKPPKLASICNVRGFTNYPNRHGYSHEFVTINKNGQFLGRIPLDDKLVYWFIARPETPQGTNS